MSTIVNDKVLLNHYVETIYNECYNVERTSDEVRSIIESILLDVHRLKRVDKSKKVYAVVYQDSMGNDLMAVFSSVDKARRFVELSGFILLEIYETKLDAYFDYIKKPTNGKFTGIDDIGIKLTIVDKSTKIK